MPAIYASSAMLRFGPSKETLAATAKSGNLQIHTLWCGFNGSLQHRLQISLLGYDNARSFLVSRLAGVRQR